MVTSQMQETYQYAIKNIFMVNSKASWKHQINWLRNSLKSPPSWDQIDCDVIHHGGLGLGPNFMTWILKYLLKYLKYGLNF